MNRYEELRTNYKQNGHPVSQRRLAKLIGIAAPHISEIEKGRMPSLAEMKAYHNFFRVSYEYLMEETKDKISSDVFREQPLNETKIESTIRWLNDTDTKEDLPLKDAYRLLLSEEVGMLFVYCISQQLYKDEAGEMLKTAINEFKTGGFDRLSYNEMLQKIVK